MNPASRACKTESSTDTQMNLTLESLKALQFSQQLYHRMKELLVNQKDAVRVLQMESWKGAKMKSWKVPQKQRMKALAWELLLEHLMIFVMDT